MSDTMESTDIKNEKEQSNIQNGDLEVEQSLEWSPADEKALVRKIDTRIFPMLILLLILSFIDGITLPMPD
jgi:hypothetical protein